MMRAGCLVILVACSAPRSEGLSDQLEPEGPCWRVNLADGLDSTSTAELHDLYACVNAQGTIEALRPVDEAMEAPSRSGEPLGLEPGRLLDGVMELELNPWGLLDWGLELLEEEEGLELAQELVLELIYGQPAITIQEASPEAADVEAGLAAPALRWMGPLSTAVLDEAPEAPAELAEALTSEVADDLVCTVGVWLDSPGLSELPPELMTGLGGAIEATRSPENDRWGEASGDSLRDAAHWLLGPGSAERRGPFADPVEGLLQDELYFQLRHSLESELEGEDLAALPTELAWLATVDVEGGELEEGEPSALEHLLRLLSAANQPLTCDLGPLEGLVDIDNLAVFALRFLALQDPEAAAGGLDLLLGLLDLEVFGVEITEELLDLVVGTGACPALTEELVADLEAVDRLSDPEAGRLLPTLIRLLRAFVYVSDYSSAELGEVDPALDDRGDVVPELVEIIDQLYLTGAIDPVSELLVDLRGSPLWTTAALDLLPALLSPPAAEPSLCPEGSEVLGLDRAWEALDGGLELDPGLSRVIEVAVAEDEGWELLGRAAPLLQDDRSALRRSPELLVTLVAIDPNAGLRAELAPLLASPAVTTPLLHLTESPALADALLETEPGSPGPLPFFASLITEGTLESVLLTVDLLLDALQPESTL